MEWLCGIDTAAHIGALEACGKTIAVLGNGFRHIFPRENIGLFHRIIENGGAVVTEYEPNTSASSSRFLERNRIVSGMSLGTLVIEAAFRSGTSVTAALAKEQGRKVFCIPHEMDNMHGVGTNRLLKQGATLVLETKDIIDCFPELDYKETNQRKTINENLIPKQYLEIFRLIQKGKMDANQISRSLKEPINQVNSTLFMMEIEGLIQKLPSGEYVIKGG